MQSYEHLNPQSVDLLAPISELVGWVTSVTQDVAIGVIIGLAAASVMRRRRLRWTWAVPALIFLVVRPPLGVSPVALDTAIVCVTLRTRARQQEDLMAGGDLFAIASSYKGPLNAIRTGSRKLALRVGRATARGVLQDGRMVVGAQANGALAAIPFGVTDGGRHTLIVGATGSGKTVTETWIASRAVDAGLSVVVIDPKGDDRMRRHLAGAASKTGRRFVEWTTRGPSVYNPFGHGSASAIADKALAGERFTEPHYQRQAQRYLGYAVRALHDMGEVVSLRALVQLLDPIELGLFAQSLPVDRAKATHRYLDSLTTRQRADLGGVRDRLAIMVESDLAAWLDPETPGSSSFDLLEVIRERAVVYFALEADSLPLLAHMLGVAIVQDLQTTMATLQRDPVRALVVIDEFAAIAAEQVVHLFGRARSAGINLLLGTQELSDLRLDHHKQLQEQVLGNLSGLIAHRQVVPESAELISSLAGSCGAWRTSQASDGRWTRTRTTKPLLPAQDIRCLSPGRAAVLEFGGNASVSTVEVFFSPHDKTRSRA